ncbi:MAG TPA: hypothetical protein PKJ71_03165 [Bacteroidales bacterium]|nr:hypothetical protein [Bacteroidales bacterium]
MIVKTLRLQALFIALAATDDPGENERRLKVVREGDSHRMRIMNLSGDQKEGVLTTREKWFDSPAGRCN